MMRRFNLRAPLLAFVAGAVGTLLFIVAAMMFTMWDALRMAWLLRDVSATIISVSFIEATNAAGQPMDPKLALARMMFSGGLLGLAAWATLIFGVWISRRLRYDRG